MSPQTSNTDAKAASLYFGEVMHARLKPRSHRFSYRVMSLLIDLDRLDEADRQSPLFGVNRAALYSFHEKDHGTRDGSSLRDYAARCAAKHGIELAGGRVLLLLRDKGVIKLKDSKNILSTVKDIAENPKDLKIRELEAATIPRVLTQVDLALINTNYALEAKLDPSKDALVIEGNDSPYVNILVSRADNKDSDAMQKLAAALHSPEVKQFITEKYKGAILPAF